MYEGKGATIVTGMVYDPPHEGLPYLAVVFIDGEPAHVEPCISLDHGEGLIADALRELKIKELN